MMLLVVLLLLANRVTCSVSVSANSSHSNIFTGSFQMYNGVAKHEDVSACWTQQTAYGRLKCVELCVGDVFCMAVYAEHSTDTLHGGVGAWTCYVCGDVWDVSSLTQGEGHYATAKYSNRALSSLPDTQPALLQANFLEHRIVEGNMVAVYRCTYFKNVYHVFLVFNTTTKTWPPINSGCNQPCSVPTLRDVPITMETVNNSGVFEYRYYPVCKPGEALHRYEVCVAYNKWTLYEALCVPLNCYKLDIDNGAIYGGHVNTTTSGIPCQSWSEYYPHVYIYNWNQDDKFIADHYNRSLAKNYCRGQGRPKIWCFTTNPGVQTEPCDVPMCD